jgi:hypothetical protein
MFGTPLSHPRENVKNALMTLFILVVWCVCCGMFTWIRHGFYSTYAFAIFGIFSVARKCFSKPFWFVGRENNVVLSKTITDLSYVTNSVTAVFEVSAAQLEASAHCAQPKETATKRIDLSVSGAYWNEHLGTESSRTGSQTALWRNTRWQKVQSIL